MHPEANQEVEAIAATITVRPADAGDAPKLSFIYNAEIARGTANYETEPEDVSTRRQWLADLAARDFPVVVAERGGEIVGFAALTPFHRLSGYRFTVSGSLYVAEGYRRAGVGRALAQTLLESARARGYHSILAGVSSENRASLALLETFGFQRVGYFREIGRKNERWHDDVCLQFILENHPRRERNGSTKETP